jgi:hypothetical protein
MSQIASPVQDGLTINISVDEVWVQINYDDYFPTYCSAAPPHSNQMQGEIGQAHMRYNYESCCKVRYSLCSEIVVITTTTLVHFWTRIAVLISEQREYS